MTMPCDSKNCKKDTDNYDSLSGKVTVVKCKFLIAFKLISQNITELACSVQSIINPIHFYYLYWNGYAHLESGKLQYSGRRSRTDDLHTYYN